MSAQNVADALGLDIATHTPLDLVHKVREGIPKKAMSLLATHLDVTISELAQYLHVSERTLQRYQPEKTLSPALSDHILQIAKVYMRGVEVFGIPEDSAKWMKQPHVGLGNIAPLELMDTSTGIEMVLNELTRIEYGVVS